MIIKHRAVCRRRWDSKSAQWRHTHGRFSNDITSLCWLCYPVGTFSTWRDVQLSCGGENQFLFDILITMFWIKPTKMCSIGLITSVHIILWKYFLSVSFSFKHAFKRHYGKFFGRLESIFRVILKHRSIVIMPGNLTILTCTSLRQV